MTVVVPSLAVCMLECVFSFIVAMLRPLLGWQWCGVRVEDRFGQDRAVLARLVHWPLQTIPEHSGT